MASNGTNGAQDFRLADCLVQPQLNRVARNGETTQIEPKVMRVLVCLAERAAQVVTREELLTAVWGDVFVSEQVLSRSISELRKVLADDAKTIIETIPKTGYRLIAPVVYEPAQTNGHANTGAASAESAAAPVPPTEKLSVVGVGRHRLIAGLLLAGLAVAAAWRWFGAQPSAAPPLMRLSLNLAETLPPELNAFQTLALSPDGRRLVYVARRAGKYQLFLRALEQAEATPLPGTEGGTGPFFSPDGEWIGFYSEGTLKKVAVSGGAPVIIGGNATDPSGAWWAADGTIYFVRRAFEGLWRIPAAGGKAEPLTTLDHARGERSHFWPELLPDGETLLFTVWHGGSQEDSEIAAFNVRTGARKIVTKGFTHAHSLPTGQLALARNGSLRVAPFDARRLELTGEPVKTSELIVSSPVTGAAHFAVANNGLLVYWPAAAADRAGSELLRVDRQGQTQPYFHKKEFFWTPRLSRDGQRLAVALPGKMLDVWIYEAATDAFKRLTFDRINLAPLLTPDARRVVFSSDAGGALNLYWKPADGSGESERLTQSPNLQMAGAWTPDGRTLIYAEVDPQTRWDIWTLEVPDRTPRPLLNSPLDEAQPALSPDGRWLAYSAKDGGQWQIYVQPFPDLNGKWQVSIDGGQEPLWSPNGKELFFRAGDRLLSVAIDGSNGFKPSAPQTLFTGNFQHESITMLPGYGVLPDGKHFLMLRSAAAAFPTQLNVLLGWSGNLTLQPQP
jgi:serine/threonine-protein kinase